MTGDEKRIAAGHRRFAEVEAAPVSPLYARLADAVAGDEQVLAFLAGLPAGKRQPNLLLAAVPHPHGTPDGFAGLGRAVLEDGERLRATMLARATRTNEPARRAALLPLLGAVPGPLALIEVGASACASTRTATATTTTAPASVRRARWSCAAASPATVRCRPPCRRSRPASAST